MEAMNKTQPSAGRGRAAEFAGHALSLGAVAAVLAAIGVACIAGAVRHIASPIETLAVMDSTVMTSLDDVIDDTCRGVARVVRPAMARTQKVARDPRVAAAILSGDRGRQTEVCNQAVVDATEIDALALFDRDGTITAINSKYPSGQPIAPDRVNRILRMSFSGRDIIQKCTRNTTDDQALEFQTKCDITPAFFDSSGLSIAYSVAVKDDATGAKIGVVSSRLCFKRLTDLIASHGSGARKYSIDFITDQGTYFSEEINSGQAAPPIAHKQLAKIVEPLVAGKTKVTFSRLGEKYLLVFRLNEFTTLDGGGPQVMATADESWLAGEARHVRELETAERAAVGLLFLCLAALTFAIAHLRRSQRRLRRDLDERRKANMLLQREIEERVARNTRRSQCTSN